MRTEKKVGQAIYYGRYKAEINLHFTFEFPGHFFLFHTFKNAIALVKVKHSFQVKNTSSNFRQVVYPLGS